MVLYEQEWQSLVEEQDLFNDDKFTHFLVFVVGDLVDRFFGPFDPRLSNSLGDAAYQERNVNHHEEYQCRLMCRLFAASLVIQRTSLADKPDVFKRSPYTLHHQVAWYTFLQETGLIRSFGQQIAFIDHIVHSWVKDQSALVQKSTWEFCRNANPGYTFASVAYRDLARQINSFLAED